MNSTEKTPTKKEQGKQENFSNHFKLKNSTCKSKELVPNTNPKLNASQLTSSKKSEHKQPSNQPILNLLEDYNFRKRTHIINQNRTGKKKGTRRISTFMNSRSFTLH